MPFELGSASDVEFRAEVDAGIAACGAGNALHITGWLSASSIGMELLATPVLSHAQAAARDHP
jgi:hypothetical protein